MADAHALGACAARRMGSSPDWRTTHIAIVSPQIAVPAGRDRATGEREVAVTGNETGTARPIRVLLADNHSLFRKGLRRMLDIEEDVEVVGEARDGAEVQRLARELHPDVVLLDINMPGVDGIAAARELRQAAPKLGILMLTLFAEEDSLTRVVEAGANGYLLKDIPFDQIAAAVRAVARGETVLPPRANLRAPSL